MTRRRFAYEENIENGRRDDAEKDFNLAMTKILEEHGYQVFLPQRDGIEAVNWA